MGSDLLERAVLAAVDAAGAAVEPWYGDRDGGTTVTIAAITPWRVVVAAVGDSPGFVVRDSGRVELVTPRAVGHRLERWVGHVPRLEPWLGSWPRDGATGGAVLVATDGIDIGAAAAGAGLGVLGGLPARVGELLAAWRGQDGDDATLAAAVLTPAPGWSAAAAETEVTP